MNNPSLCNQMDDSDQRIECMARVADLKSDPKVCVESNASDVDCVVRYAQRRGNNLSACDSFSDPVKKYTCVAKITGDSTGRSLDIIIGDFNTRGKVTACLNQCITDMNTCNGNCGETMVVKSGDCYGLDYTKREQCNNDVLNEKNTCLVKCREVASGPCDAKCREMG